MGICVFIYARENTNNVDFDMFLCLQHSRTMSQTSMNFYETTQTQRDIIAQLEAKNREIMREIARLK